MHLLRFPGWPAGLFFQVSDCLLFPAHFQAEYLSLYYKPGLTSSAD